ncbi:MAG: hypothetical protein WBQ25_15970 [Nitrososphaeraceae archaeon]
MIREAERSCLISSNSIAKNRIIERGEKKSLLQPVEVSRHDQAVAGVTRMPGVIPSTS